jgi:hypothetical protein
MLMTNFNKTGKTELSSLANWSIRFLQFQSKTEEEAKLKDLKIQIVLKQKNELKCAAILLCTSSSGRPPDPVHSPPCHFPQEQQPHYAYGYGYALQPQPAEDGLLEEDDACIRH